MECLVVQCGRSFESKNTKAKEEHDGKERTLGKSELSRRARDGKKRDILTKLYL